MEDKYVKIKALGKGSFGSAILIRRKSDGELLVVKEVNLTKMSSKEREEARNECKVLQSLRHPNIVRYIEHYELRGILYIVMEYADGGDLSHKIKEGNGRGLKESTIMYYFSQLSLAIEYLHSRHVLHRDIKTMNIFLMKNGSVKLGDFGISTVLRNTMGMANTVCGTPYYFSPELCKNRPYNNRSDIWAMGVVLYEMMTTKHPYDANSMQQLMQRIVRSTYAPVPTTYSRELRQLLDACLEKEPMRRPNIKQLLSFPSVRGALEKLETDLMLATQCRVRLQDIMDFPRGSGRSSESQSSGGVSLSPSPQQLIVQHDPRVPPPVSGRRASVGVSPQRVHASPAASPPPVVLEPNQIKADMDRVDAFIRQLNRPVNDRAKDAIQEYMRKKQDEVAAQRKREDEHKKKQEDRKLELKKIMEDHQKQMLEHAKMKMQRVQQQGVVPQPQHLPAAVAPLPLPQQHAPSPAPNNKPRRPVPASLEAVYGHPTPRKNVRHVLAANSPANAKRFQANGPITPQPAPLQQPQHLPAAVAPLPLPQQQAPSPAPNNKPRRPVPASLEAVYGHPTPRKNVRHVLAANSPANAKRFQANGPVTPQPAPLQPPSAANITPSQQQLFPPRPRPVAVANAQHWVDKQAEKRRGEMEDKQVRRVEDERRMVRDLDRYGNGGRPSPGNEALSNPVVDPELAAWVKRTSNVGDAVSHSARSSSPQAGGNPLHYHDVPAGVDARRRVSQGGPERSVSPQLEVHRNAAAAGAVLRASAEPLPRTPPDRPGRQDFRRVGGPGSTANSRSSSCASMGAPGVFKPSEVPQASLLDNSPDVQQRTAPHGMLGGVRQDDIPFVRYGEVLDDDVDGEELHVAVPEIIRSIRAPSNASPRADSLTSPDADVPVEAYTAMLSHLKEVLEKKPPSHVASRHQTAILDADAIGSGQRRAHRSNDISPTRGDGSVVETEEYMMGGDSDEEEEEEGSSNDDDFEDEEPITPSHPGAPMSTSQDDDEDGFDDPDETNSFRLRHICGQGFRGHIAVHPKTGAPLFPLGSVSKHTNEFQLRIALERRLSVAGLDAVTLQLEALPVGSSMEARILDEIRGAAAMYLAKVKRCPTSAIAPQEAADCVALCAQLLFFQED
ncbi:protein kinase, putative [Bodo saltans]|uniref:non-specific serine/threonine protein kinase n=1 Tax=Bodo saltans TaxID=75058 RepID=A0A0S4JPB5_BODSA|nr:protein kinase, putative [Bodo saltans]|eukprot:CUG91988.1 protein kinase, putative [Bodo saltans]